MAHPPKNLQPFLWSTRVDMLDLARDKSYIVHQLLLYGTLKELKWLFHAYTKKEIIDVFLRHPIKMYPKDMYIFIKDYILKLGGVRLDENKYVTSLSGPVEPRAAGRLA